MYARTCFHKLTRLLGDGRVSGRRVNRADRRCFDETELLYIRASPIPVHELLRRFHLVSNMLTWYQSHRIMVTVIIRIFYRYLLISLPTALIPPCDEALPNFRHNCLSPPSA